MFEKIVFWTGGITFATVGLIIFIFIFIGNFSLHEKLLHIITSLIIVIISLSVIPNLKKNLYKTINFKLSKNVEQTITLVLFIIWAIIASYSYGNTEDEEQKYIRNFSIFFLFLGFLFLAAYSKDLEISTESRKKKKFLSIFENIDNFRTTQYILGVDLSSAIAIDDDKKQICLITIENAIEKHVIIPYKDILSSEIVEDNSSLIKTARGSQLGGALIGGILLGGAGAIIGGLSGKKHTMNKIKNIDLLIVVNNTDKPIFKINLLSTKKYNNQEGYYKDSSEYKSAASKAKKWQSIISIIIKNTDEKDKKAEKQNKPIENSTNISISDEIRKLKSLKDDGLITENEFLSQKEKLLNS